MPSKEGDYISVNTSLRSQNESFPIYTSSYLKDAAREANVLTSNFNFQPVRHFTTNLNYNKKFSNKSLLFAGAQFTKFSRHTKSEIPGNDVAANGRFYDNVREFSVGVKYSFGSLKTSIYKNREVDENTNRVR